MAKEEQNKQPSTKQIEDGVQYVDKGGVKLGRMNVTTSEVGDFWCAMNGDSRYYDRYGKCTQIFGTANEKKKLSSDMDIDLDDQP